MKISLALPLCLMLLFISTAPVAAQSGDIIRLDRPWKFQPSDSASFSRPDYDDSGWKTLRVDDMWEELGYPSLDGFAWYRTHITIPSSLLRYAPLKDSIGFFLGKIDDLDQVYLNGMLLGVNGRTVQDHADTALLHADPNMWQTERRYAISTRDPRIRWDSVNVIAVRVLDEGGMGGMWSGGQMIRIMRLLDYLQIDRSAQTVFSGRTITKPVKVRNTSARYRMTGTLTIDATGKLSGKPVARDTKRIDLDPQSTLEFPLGAPAQEQSTVVTYTCVLSPHPDTLVAWEELAYLLTPPAPRKARINSPGRYGARPGRPFLYTIPASGDRPMVFKAEGLPRGLELDPLTGIISGRVAEPGTYRTRLFAKNRYGEATRTLAIVIGDTIALSPPLGWNSWNAWGLSVDQGKVIASARVFREKGLMDHGWVYINIDDGWEINGDDPRPKRHPDGSIIVNEKFPDMKALGDSIHALGLKLGIYSSPGPLTCGGYTATYGYEDKDAQSYAGWGIDYLKYDWCSYGKIAPDTSRRELMKPYMVMRSALDKVNRDILFSLCQYGMGNVWEWGTSVGGNCWRTTGDITDTWQSMRDIGFHQIANQPYAGPGHWNDPDMLVVGWVGWGPSLHPTRLTPDEQYTHITLWSLLSAPMLIGCDLTRLDPFTLNLLTNDEVIALNQDALGKQARRLVDHDSIQVWVKDLDDGSRAAGIFNLSGKTASYTLDLGALGYRKPVAVRDLWRQRDLGRHRNSLPLFVASHGVILLQLR